MRLRKLALAVGLAGTLGAQMASALGLGEIKLYSKLNEPLNAEIRLLQVKDLSKNEVLVALASSDDFKRAGIEREFFLTDLRFDVVLDGPSGPVIRVTSQKPVKEPYLNFLLESQWPNGRILREYTLLMDLPTFADQRPAPVQSARASVPAAPAPARTPPVAPSPAPAAPAAAPSNDDTPAPRAPEPRTSAATPASTPAYQNDIYGPVATNDTLWAIALKVRPNRQYSVHQTMVALQQLNPDAFINGNINLLREGQVLRVPTSNDLDNISAQQAVAEVAQQNAAWSERNGTPVGPQLEGSKRTRAASTDTGTGISGRLTVGGAGAAESAQAGRASGAAGGDSPALQRELASSMEELDSARRENAELKDRVAEMEEQIKTMERLLEVSSEEFRALQQNIAARNAEQAKDRAAAASDTAAEGPEATDAATTPAQPDNDAAGDVAVTDIESAAVANAGAEATALPPEAEVRSEVNPEAKPAAEPVVKSIDTSRVVQSAPKKPSFLDLLRDNILYVGAGALAILAAALFLVRRRKAEQEQEAQEASVLPVAAAATAAAVTAHDNDAVGEPDVADDFSTSYDEINLSAEDDLFAEDDIPVEAETGDAVAEADIYISYGKLDQAEDLLNKALEQDPGNLAARMKLLDVFLAAGNVASFDEQMAVVLATGDNASIDRAEFLRQQFVDAPAFGDLDTDNDFALADEPLELDLDLGEDTFTDTPAKDSDFVLGEDFGLSFAASLTAAESAAPSAETEAEGLSLELDEAMLAAEDDFLADLDSADLDFELPEGEEPLALDLDLSGFDELDEQTDEELSPEPFTDALAAEELPVAPEADSAEEELEVLDLELADDEAFDLALGDMDLAALDEEVSALSESIDFAGEEFGLDETPNDEALNDEPLNPEAALTLDDDLTEAPEELADEISLAETLPADDNADLGELSMDEDFDLDELDLGDLAFAGEDLAADHGDLPLTLEDDFSAEFAELEEDTPEIATADAADANTADLQASDLADDEVPTLSLDEADSLLSPDEEESLFSLEDSDEELAALDELLPVDEGAEEVDAEQSAESAADVSGSAQAGTEDLVSAAEPAADLTDEEPGELDLDETDFATLDESDFEEFDLAADLGLDDSDFAASDEQSEDELFSEDLSELPAPEDALAGEDDFDAELDFLADTDEAATKLDLARAYIDMGDQDGAKDILSEVVIEGNEAQKLEAEELLSRLG